MAISPVFAFETCWEIYQRIQEESQAIALLRTDNPAGCGSGGWRPVGLEAKDYAADFVLAGQAALQPGHRFGHARFHMESLQILFRAYYVQLAPYEKVRRHLGLTERVWSDWADEIRDKVGRELMRRRLFPPREYFGERTRPRKRASDGKRQPETQQASEGEVRGVEGRIFRGSELLERDKVRIPDEHAYR